MWKLRGVPGNRVAGCAAMAWMALFALVTWAAEGHQRAQLLVGDVVYVVPITLATALAVLASRRARGHRRRFWRVLAVSNLLWLSGDVTWAVYDLVLQRQAPFPSLADGFYLASYALVPPAVLLGFGGASVLRRLRALLDAGIVTLALAVAGWQFLVAPQLGGRLTLAGATGIAYPLLGVAILITLLSVGFAGHRRVPPSVVLVGAAFGASALTDAGYTYLAALHDYVSGSWLNLGWQLEAVLLCLAALRALRHREAATEVSPFARDLGLVPVLVGVAVTLLVLAGQGGQGRLSVTTLLTAVLVIAGLVVRLLLSVADSRRFAVRLQEVQADRAVLLDQTLRRGEEERVRIAAELHDGPVQRLAALRYLLERAQRLTRRGEQRGEALLEQALLELGAEVDALRRLMADLRPPVLDESGLENALRDHLAAVFGPAGVDAEVVGGLGAERVPAEVETVLYRVAQEALLNVTRHAAASRVRVLLDRTPGVVTLRVQDDGVGFTPQQARARLREGHFGLIGMRERVELGGGVWHLDSTPGRGTTITATMPDQPDQPDRLDQPGLGDRPGLPRLRGEHPQAPAELAGAGATAAVGQV